MEFYIIRALFPVLIIDIFLAIILLNQGKNGLAAFFPVPLYFINAYAWMVFLGATNSAFSGQGAIGLGIIIGIGIVFAILRLILGIVMFINMRGDD